MPTLSALLLAAVSGSALRCLMLHSSMSEGPAQTSISHPTSPVHTFFMSYIFLGCGSGMRLAALDMLDAMRRGLGGGFTLCSAVVVSMLMYCNLGAHIFTLEFMSHLRH